MVGYLLAAHILDLYDIHARNCLPEDFPTRAAELLRRFTEELASGSYRRYRIWIGTPKSYASRRTTSRKSVGEQADAAQATSSTFLRYRRLRNCSPTNDSLLPRLPKSFRFLRRLTLRDTSRNTSACRPRPFAMPDPTKSFRFSGSWPHLLIGQEYGRLAEK